MKQTTTKRTVIVLIMMMLTTMTAWAWSGSGTAESPYQIKSTADLDQLATDVNSGTEHEGDYFVLTTDLTYSHETDWNDASSTENNFTPIGGYNNNFRYFKGHFDGQSHTISGIRIYQSGSETEKRYAALFGQLSNGAEVKNVFLADARFTGYYYCGPIVGSNRGSVSNCHVLSDVTIHAVTASADYHGGIVGYNFGTITGCTSAASITAAVSCECNGGITGQGSGTVEDCIYFGSTVAGDSYVGAIVGYNSATVRNCYYISTTFQGKENHGYTLANDASATGYNTTSATIDDVRLATSDDFAVSGDTYTIGTAAGWSVMCAALYHNDTYNRFSGKTVQLGDDITVTRMAGGSNHAFTGTFDGGGHTLTVDYGTADAPFDAQFVAPFVETANDGEHQPTFRNLTIGGTIYDGYTASGEHNVGGLIGHLFGTVTIEHCTSLVEIHAKVGAGGFVGLCEHNVSFNDCHSAAVIRSADGSNSGFVAWSRASEYTIAFTGCLFDGKLLQQNGSGSLNGGFIGWTGSTKTVTITNSLCAPAPLATGETMASSGSATFARGWNATTTASNSFYTAAFEIAQGKATHTVAADADVTIGAIALTGTPTQYTVSGITAYSGGGLQLGETLYYGSGDVVSLTLSNSATGAPQGYQYGYTASAGTLSGTTLTMPDQDVTISVNTAELAPIDWATVNQGNSAEDPYMIYNKDQLLLLAYRVNGTHGETRQTDGYYGKYFKLGADIDFTSADMAFDGGQSNYEAIGGYNNNTDCFFRGHFDGNDKFITGLTINKPDDLYQGLFGYTSGATFKNVNIVNCSVNAKYCVSGLVGYLSGGTIEKCTVTGTIQGSSQSQFIGGIAGNAYYATIKNCFSDATVEGGYYAGSIMGTMNSTATDNYHSATTIGGVGTYYSNEDKPGAEIAAKISAGTGVTITYPENPSCVWNGENLYKSGTVVTLTYTVPTGNVFDHYSVSSGQISNPGTQGGEHTLTGFTQDVVISGSYADSQRDIADGAIANITALTFNGRAQQPKPVVTYGDERLVEYENYTVTYSEGCTNAGKYSVYVTGTGRYTGSLSKEYTISPLNISTDGAITILGIEANYGKTGSAVHPKPAAVTSSAANNATLVEGTDYSLSYNGDCILPGNYSITLTGQGNYTGEKAVPFTILDAFGITLHNGTATNSSVPVYGSYCDIYPRSEFLMPKSELTAMSGKAVTSMQFYLCSKARQAWGGTFQVFMKEVEGTTLSGFSGTDGATIVYEGSLDGTGNVMTVNFDTPYAYNGGNLLVGFYRTTKDVFSEVSFYGETVSGASVFGYTNVFGPCSANQGNFLPKTTLWYEEMTTLADNATDNSTTIDNKNSQTTKVRLEGRTLYQDGDWNTICLPFDVTLANSPLAGATAKTLETASLDNGTLTLNFGNDVTTLEAGTPYIIKWSSDLVIKTESDWNSFASAVADDNTYEGKVVRLDADISVSTSVGSQTKPFKGVFDGCGHTLNVTLTGNSQGCAPFGGVEGATIVNLKTTGTVTLSSSSAYHASGLVGFSNGSTIKNCHVSVSVLFPSGTGTVHSGGIIGHALKAPFTMTDCLFDGTIGYVDGGTGTMTNVGGLVGWHDDSTPNITHCFNGGTFANPSVIAQIARVEGNGTITDCYTNVNADCQGDHGDSRGDYTNATGSELQALLGDGWKVDDQGNVVPIFGKYTTTITNPSFANVTIDKNDRSITSGGVTFKGNYDAQTFNAENKSILFVGGNNSLYWPTADATIGACRAYFELNDGQQARNIVLNFGDDNATGIHSTTNCTRSSLLASLAKNFTNLAGAWYTLDGRKLAGKPSAPGIYVKDGHKVAIKREK